MLRRIPVIAACAAALAFSALPASRRGQPYSRFRHSRRLWRPRLGNVQRHRDKVRVTVCVEVTARSVYGAAAVGLAFDSAYRRHDNVSAVTIGDGHTQCRVMVTRYVSHLVVEALSGYKNGKVRQQRQAQADLLTRPRYQWM